MKIYLGNAADLGAAIRRSPEDAPDRSPARLFTNLSELWLDDPSKRRLMRRHGIEESVVTGEFGDYRLLEGFLRALSSDPRAAARARTELSALGIDDDLSDPCALWTRSSELLAEHAADLTARFAADPDIRTLCSLTETPAHRDVLTLGALYEMKESFNAALDALSRAAALPITCASEFLDALTARIESIPDTAGRALLLTLTDCLPPCLRTTDEQADAALTALREKHRSSDNRARDLLRSRLLFALLPVLRKKEITLILRVGAIEHGDGRLPCGFHAASLVDIAARLGRQMPRILLAPRSLRARSDLQTIDGIFPAISGKPAISIPPKAALSFHRTPLSLLASSLRE